MTARSGCGRREKSMPRERRSPHRRTAATTHASALAARRARDDRRGNAGLEPPSAIHFSSLPRSAAFCQRSSGSLARHFLTTRSSAGGDIG